MGLSFTIAAGPHHHFYCLGFETSLFVASYDSQGYGGGIRSRLHTGVSWAKVKLRLTVSQSVSLGVEPRLSFAYAAGPRQLSLSRVRVPWDS
jgi:hypothetical protein